MNKSSKSGGGINSKNVQHFGGVNPGYAGQIGTALGNKVMEKGPTVDRAAVPMKAGGAVKVAMGNELAVNVGRGGPGKGRTVHCSGSQGQHGPGREGEGGIGHTRDSLLEFGPDVRGRR
jgi:hypothetical protein